MILIGNFSICAHNFKRNWMCSFSLTFFDGRVFFLVPFGFNSWHWIVYSAMQCIAVIVLLSISHEFNVFPYTYVFNILLMCKTECVVCYCLRKNIVKKESARKRRGKKKRTRWRKQNLETQRWLCIERTVFSEKWVSANAHESRSIVNLDHLSWIRFGTHSIRNTHEKLVYFYCLCQLCAHREHTIHFHSCILFTLRMFHL